MNKAASISECGRYRYSLTRQWDKSLPCVVFVMLNPSTADATIDDPTIRRCIGFAKSWGAGTLQVVNLFGLRATDPAELWGHPDPVGPENDEHVRRAFDNTRKVVVAWGADGSRFGILAEKEPRDRQMLGLMHLCGVTPWCLGTTKKGHPRHPLYVPASAELRPYTPPEEKKRPATQNALAKTALGYKNRRSRRQAHALR